MRKVRPEAQRYLTFHLHKQAQQNGGKGKAKEAAAVAASRRQITSFEISRHRGGGYTGWGEGTSQSDSAVISQKSTHRKVDGTPLPPGRAHREDADRCWYRCSAVIIIASNDSDVNAASFRRTFNARSSACSHAISARPVAQSRCRRITVSCDHENNRANFPAVMTPITFDSISQANKHSTTSKQAVADSTTFREATLPARASKQQTNYREIVFSPRAL